MKRLAIAILLLVVGCTPAPAPEPAANVAAPAPDATPAVPAAPAALPADDPAAAWERRLGNLPPDTAAVIGRVDACTHFSGEFNGDGSARDREVSARMDELHCATIEQEAVALRQSYGDRPDVMEALDMATDGAR
ncbi:MAG: hypothetical protein ACREO3_03220 [Arenimonas sp.]